MTSTVESLLSQPYDCLIMVDPHIQTLEGILSEVQSLGIAPLNIGAELSTALMTISTTERSRFAQEWFKDTLASFQGHPVACSHLDLLFHPSLEMDPFSLIRQVARIRQIIVLWPGAYSSNTLSYAIPAHHHYRAWRLSNALLVQPKVLIHSLAVPQGD